MLNARHPEEAVSPGKLRPPPWKLRPRWSGLWPALLTLLASAIIVILFLRDPALSRFYPICLFHSMTGLLCPGCGSSRAVHQLLHGHIATAFKCNAILVVSIPIVAFLFLRHSLYRRSRPPKPAPLRGVYLVVAALVLLLFAIFRNLPLPQAAWFQP